MGMYGQVWTILGDHIANYILVGSLQDKEFQGNQVYVVLAKIISQIQKAKFEFLQYEGLEQVGFEKSKTSSKVEALSI